METDVILRAYARIGELTPLSFDCGQMCGKACCAPDEDGQGGMYLFPGEEGLFAGENWCHILPGSIPPILVCDAPCPREKRPLACRIFPATPYFSKGVWTVRMDARARAVCPLSSGGIRGLSRDFAYAARDAMRIIAADPQGESFLKWWQEREEEYRVSPLG